MLVAFEAGGRSGWERGFDDSDANVDRHELVAALRTLLHPPVARDYAVIVGEVPSARAEDTVRTITGGRLALLIRYVGSHASKDQPPRFAPTLHRIRVRYQGRATGGPIRTLSSDGW